MKLFKKEETKEKTVVDTKIKKEEVEMKETETKEKKGLPKFVKIGGGILAGALALGGAYLMGTKKKDEFLDGEVDSEDDLFEEEAEDDLFEEKEKTEN